MPPGGVVRRSALLRAGSAGSAAALRPGPTPRVARALRAVRTGLAFAIFGAGALVVAGAAFPLLRLLGGDRARRERRAQYLVHLSFRLFVRIVTALGLVRVTMVGRERLRDHPAALVIANHPTLIDVVLIVAAMPQVDCVVKRAIWRNRFLRGVARGAGYLPNDEGPELVETCVERLRAGRWLLLFPEGTRSPRGGLGPFRRGASHIALGAGCDIVPITIGCDPPMLMKHQPWYRVPGRTVHLTLTVGDRLSPPGSPAGRRAVRAAREWTAEIRRLYEAGLQDARG